MSLTIDPIVSNIFYSLSLILHAATPKEITYKPLIKSESLPFVSVLITFYHEKQEDIDMTISSLINQTYPKDKYEVLMVIEPDDPRVKAYVETSIKRLREAEIFGKVVLSDGKLKIKPHALNLGIEQARGKYCAFYDASDDIEKDQMEKAISVMEEGYYEVVQAKVLRKGNSLLSHFLLLDTVLWFWKYMPFLLRFAKGMPLSGEGLFIKRSVLEEAGNFPEVLTEDAYLGLILTEKNKKFALLDSIVVEKAPKNMKAHFVQKLRWQRGYLMCLKKLLRLKISFKRKFAMLLIFITPITCAIAFIGWLMLVSYWFFQFFFPSSGLIAPLIRHPVYNDVVRYWSLFLAYIGISFAMFSSGHTLIYARMKKRYLFLPILLGIYWVFVGFCAISSFFRGTTHWGKTER